MKDVNSVMINMRFPFRRLVMANGGGRGREKKGNHIRLAHVRADRVKGTELCHVRHKELEFGIKFFFPFCLSLQSIYKPFVYFTFVGVFASAVAFIMGGLFRTVHVCLCFCLIE